MQRVLRTRVSSLSDIHIHRCDCEYCDGTGRLSSDVSFDGRWEDECPACEGLGYLDPSSDTEKAYQAYLADLYREVLREMPVSMKRGTSLSAA